jgi:hypothetical protein
MKLVPIRHQTSPPLLPFSSMADLKCSRSRLKIKDTDDLSAGIASLKPRSNQIQAFGSILKILDVPLLITSTSSQRTHTPLQELPIPFLAK